MSNSPDTIVLIHGLWMTPLSWEKWKERYESRGYKVVAPAWPGMEGDVEQLRRDPSSFERLSAAQVIDHYDQIIRGLDSPPIIMGHSFGGGFVQVLLDRGLGAAGVAIDAATTKGVLKLPASTIKSGWPILKSPANRHKAVPLTPKQFNYAFTNTLSPEESLPVYERYQIPGPGGILFEGAFANFKSGSPFKVDYDKKDRPPLLFISGGNDHVVPAAVNRANVKKYKSGVVDYKEFPGRSHFTVGQDGWEEVADYALDWAAQKTGAKETSGVAS